MPSSSAKSSASTTSTLCSRRRCCGIDRVAGFDRDQVTRKLQIVLVDCRIRSLRRSYRRSEGNNDAVANFAFMFTADPLAQLQRSGLTAECCYWRRLPNCRRISCRQYTAGLRVRCTNRPDRAFPTARNRLPQSVRHCSGRPPASRPKRTGFAVPLIENTALSA